jgi:hypothetical protein
MFNWLNRLLTRNRKKRDALSLNELTERERTILIRELADSKRNPMGDPGDSLSGATGIFGTRTDTKIGLNADARISNGSLPNIGNLSQSLSETKKN